MDKEYGKCASCPFQQSERICTSLKDKHPKVCITLLYKDIIEKAKYIAKMAAIAATFNAVRSRKFAVAVKYAPSNRQSVNSFVSARATSDSELLLKTIHKSDTIIKVTTVRTTLFTLVSLGLCTLSTSFSIIWTTACSTPHNKKVSAAPCHKPLIANTMITFII